MFQEENKVIVYYGNTKNKKFLQSSNRYKYLNFLIGERKEPSDATLFALIPLILISSLVSWNSWTKMIRTEVTEMLLHILYRKNKSFSSLVKICP